MTHPDRNLGVLPFLLMGALFLSTGCNPSSGLEDAMSELRTGMDSIDPFASKLVFTAYQEELARSDNLASALAAAQSEVSRLRSATAAHYVLRYSGLGGAELKVQLDGSGGTPVELVDVRLLGRGDQMETDSIELTPRLFRDNAIEPGRRLLTITGACRSGGPSAEPLHVTLLRKDWVNNRLEPAEQYSCDVVGSLGPFEAKDYNITVPAWVAEVGGTP